MEVSQNNKDCFILSCIQEYFYTGKVYFKKRGMVKFRLVIKNILLI